MMMIILITTTITMIATILPRWLCLGLIGVEFALLRLGSSCISATIYHCISGHICALRFARLGFAQAAASSPPMDRVTTSAELHIISTKSCAGRPWCHGSSRVHASPAWDLKRKLHSKPTSSSAVMCVRLACRTDRPYASRGRPSARRLRSTAGT